MIPEIVKTMEVRIIKNSAPILPATWVNIPKMISKIPTLEGSKGMLESVFFLNHII